MDYQEYSALANEGGKLHEAGQHEAALAIFEALAEADIAAVDRGNMWQNAAFVLEKLERFDDALAAYGKAVALHLPLCRSEALEYRAALLHRLGRNAESLALYRQLAAVPWASEAELYRFRYNAAALEGAKA